MRQALLFSLVLTLGFAAAGTAPVRADDTDAAAIAAARAFMLAAMPGECDEDRGDDPSFPDTATALSWKPDWGDGSEPDEKATLYRIFCMAGAYNEVHAFVMKPEDGALSLVTFAEPTFDVQYAEGDEFYIELKAPPKTTGFATTATLVNSDFDVATGRLMSFSKWRGLGDAWAAGTWELRGGRFVLSEYVVDPIYEASADNPSEELIDTWFQLYP